MNDKGNCMRLKEFIIFIIIFTVLYIIFFVVLDKIALKKSIENEKKRIQSYMNTSIYYPFANFYGIQSTITNELLYTIFLEIQQMSNMKISTYSTKYQISSYEFIVILLYFEYFHLIGRKSVSFEDDFITQASYADQNLIYKYGSYFLAKSDFPKILANMGNIAISDITYLNRKFLIPGVRVVNSNIIYVGDLNEKA